MAQESLHRRSIEQAIENASKSHKWAPCEDISVDAAFLILRQIERRRESAVVRPQGKALYQIVEHMCFQTGFDPGRRRLYQLTLMAYYRIIKSRKEKRDKLLAMRRQARASNAPTQSVE